MQKKLSIVVPVYNVEKFIRPCLESVFGQGLDDEDYELIVVNDGTPDRSMEMIADLLSQHSNITVINQANQGVSIARNNGMSKATGDYILFLDSDDMLVESSLPVILKQALEKRPDIIVADYLKMNDEDVSSSKVQVVQPDIIEWTEITGRELFYKYERVTVWHRLYRLGFLLEHHIQFMPGVTYEDNPFTYECYLKGARCLKTNMLLNIYRRHKDSITTSFTLSSAENLAIAINGLWRLREQVSLNQQEYKRLEAVTFKFFVELIERTFTHISGFFNQLRAMDLISHAAPDLSFTAGRPQKIITFLYKRSPRLLMTVWKIKWLQNKKGHRHWIFSEQKR